METPQIDKNDFLFIRLVLTFQSAAMQQLGKIMNPGTGKIERELDQASASIDTLAMLQEKCKGNLKEDEENLLDRIVSELKLNYVDEIGRPQPVEEQEQNEDEDSEEQPEKTEGESSESEVN